MVMRGEAGGVAPHRDKAAESLCAVFHVDGGAPHEGLRNLRRCGVAEGAAVFAIGRLRHNKERVTKDYWADGNLCAKIRPCCRYKSNNNTRSISLPCC